MSELDHRKRLIQLESARGIASIIVVFHHFVLAFIPYLKSSAWKSGLLYTPLYALFNGGGAVTYFFMLSGFVLALTFFRRFSRPNLMIAILKRFPRLMIPAGASILLGYLVMRYLFPLHQSAAVLGGSHWLAEFGLANLRPGVRPSLLDALRQCLLVLVVPNQYYYNSNLWTMINEFYGSIIVFALVFASNLPVFRNSFAITSMHVCAIMIFWIIHYSFVPFVIGSYLAYLYAKNVSAIRTGTGATWMLLAGALIGFSGESWIAWTLSSLCVMIVLLGNRTIAARMSGPVGAWMGTISFPLYLVHTIVILSLSSFVFSTFFRAGAAPAIVLLSTLGATLLASLALALPFVVLDRKWVSWLNHFARSVAARIGYAPSHARPLPATDPDRP